MGREPRSSPASRRPVSSPSQPVGPSLPAPRRLRDSAGELAGLGVHTACHASASSRLRANTAPTTPRVATARAEAMVLLSGLERVLGRELEQELLDLWFTFDWVTCAFLTKKIMRKSICGCQVSRKDAPPLEKKHCSYHRVSCKGTRHHCQNDLSHYHTHLSTK